MATHTKKKELKGDTVDDIWRSRLIWLKAPAEFIAAGRTFSYNNKRAKEGKKNWQTAKKASAGVKRACKKKVYKRWKINQWKEIKIRARKSTHTHTARLTRRGWMRHLIMSAVSFFDGLLPLLCRHQKKQNLTAGPTRDEPRLSSSSGRAGRNFFPKTDTMAYVIIFARKKIWLWERRRRRPSL